MISPKSDRVQRRAPTLIRPGSDLLPKLSELLSDPKQSETIRKDFAVQNLTATMLQTVRSLDRTVRSAGQTLWMLNLAVRFHPLPNPLPNEFAA